MVQEKMEMWTDRELWQIPVVWFDLKSYERKNLKEIALMIELSNEFDD